MSTTISSAHILADLKKSNLSARDQKDLDIKFLIPKATAKLLKNPNQTYYAYEIPYFDVEGNKTGFSRVRFLEDVIKENSLTAAQGFKKDKDTGKSPKIIRYSQASGSGCHLYIPPLINWVDVARDTSQSIIITEGEKKAACATKHGIPTIALGGVWSFMENRTYMINDFKQFNWKERNVIICYDNDLAMNQDVLDAEDKLALSMLHRLGARVFIKRLPFNGTKMGIDDFIVKHGAEVFSHIPIEETRESVLLHDVNNHALWVNSMGMTMDKKGGFLIGKNKEEPSLSPYCMVDKIRNEDDKLVGLVRTWLKWPGRKTVDQLCYEPAKGEFVNNNYNTWKGWGVKSIKGNIQPFKDLINHLLEKCSKAEKDYFMKWLAYPIQNPGEKIKVGTLIYGIQQGTGKSFLGYIIGDIYGSNFIKITQTALDTPFNSWAVNKQFVLGEEISGSDRRKHNNEVKDMLTRETITVNRKYEPEYQVKDCTNYYFTSNHPDAVFLEDTDRRFYILESTNKRLPMDIIERLNEWRKEGGASHLLWHLQNRIDCSDFSQHGPAPMTSFKEDMMYISKSGLERFAQELLQDPDSVTLKNGEIIDKSWFDREELMWFYDPNGTKNVSERAFSNALRRIGLQSTPTHISNGTKRLYCIRNRNKKWRGKAAALDYCSVQVIPDRKARLTIAE